MAEGLKFPFSISQRGVAAASPRGQQIKEQLEQLLFTLPGERVTRPDFGCGVQRLVFAGASEDTAAAAEYTITTAIRDYMDDVVQLDAVRVTVHDVTLYIDILYTLKDDGTELSAHFSQPLGGTP
jgi:phage baseplate assembly protein W